MAQSPKCAGNESVSRRGCSAQAPAACFSMGVGILLRTSDIGAFVYKRDMAL